jgi:hypothetical protein
MRRITVMTRVDYLDGDLLAISYAAAADAGLESFAGQFWLEDGIYEWDRDCEGHPGSAGVEATLLSDHHQGLLSRGVAHPGAPANHIEGDRATEFNMFEEGAR